MSGLFFERTKKMTTEVNKDIETIVALKEMAIHDELVFGNYIVLRVVDGWIYNNQMYEASVFVPLRSK